MMEENILKEGLIIQELWNKIPQSKCPYNDCSDCCAGVTIFSIFEMENLEEQKNLNLTNTGHCPHLIDNKCQIYNKRPLICRLYGLLPNKYSCIHGKSPIEIIDNKKYDSITEKKILRKYFDLHLVNGVYYPDYKNLVFKYCKNSTEILFLQKRNSQHSEAIVGIKKRSDGKYK